MFEIIHDAKRLNVVFKTAVIAQQSIQSLFTGMAERRMTQIVRQRDRFGQQRVDTDSHREHPGEAGDFQRMGQSRAVVISLRIDEHLRFVLKSAKGGATGHATPILFEGTTFRLMGGFLGVNPSESLIVSDCE